MGSRDKVVSETKVSDQRLPLSYKGSLRPISKFLPPFQRGAVVAPVFVQLDDLPFGDSGKGYHMKAHGTICYINVDWRSPSSRDRFHLLDFRTQWPGYSQLARMNSAAVKCSLVQCQFTTAFGARKVSITCAS